MHDFFLETVFSDLERNDVEPGMLLLSVPGMQEPDFARSAILVLECEGSVVVGVDLTRRTSVASAEVCPDWKPVLAKPQAVYLGGPYHLDCATGLALTKLDVDLSQEPFLRRLTNRMAMVEMNIPAEDVIDKIHQIRIFAGVHMWTAQELREQIEAGLWYVAPALPGDVVAPGHVDLWGSIMRRNPMPLPLYATFPRNPRDN